MVEKFYKLVQIVPIHALKDLNLDMFEEYIFLIKYSNIQNNSLKNIQNILISYRK